MNCNKLIYIVVLFSATIFSCRAKEKETVLKPTEREAGQKCKEELQKRLSKDTLVTFNDSDMWFSKKSENIFAVEGKAFIRAPSKYKKGVWYGAYVFWGCRAEAVKDKSVDWYWSVTVAANKDNLKIFRVPKPL